MAEIASAYLSILPSFKGGGGAITRQAEGPIAASGKSLGRTFGKLFALTSGLLIAGGLTKIFSGSIDEAREAQKVGAQTEAVIKSTGGAAGLSAKQFGTLATTISNYAGIDDEAIQSGENLLATFTNIKNLGGKNNIFSQATRLATDMGVALGTDTKSAALQLGKALNDPAKGFSRLQRSGVSFTDSQIDQIKNFQETGQLAKAQKIILGEVAKEFGGSAKAQATAGDKARVAFANLQETIGTALLPVIDKLATIFTDKIAPAITTFIGQLQSGEGVGGRVAAVFASIGSALGVLFTFIRNNKTVTAVFIGAVVGMTVAVAAFNAVLAANPIGLVIIGLAALAAALVYAYKHSETFRAIVDKTFSVIKKVVTSVVGFIVPFVKNHWQLLIAIIGGPLGIVVGLVIKHFDTVKKVVGIAAQFVLDSAKKYVQFVGKVIDTVGKVVTFFKNLPGKITGALSKLPGEMKQVGVDIVRGLIDGIKSMAKAAANAAVDVVKGAVGKAKGFLHIGSPSKLWDHEVGRMMMQGLIDGIHAKTGEAADAAGDAVDKVTKKVKEKISKLRDALSSARSDFASLVQPIASNFTQNLFDFDTASAFTANLTAVKGTLQTLLGNFKTLIGEGLSPGFLYQLFQSGGPALINSLAGLSKEDAQSAASLFGQVTSLSDQLGTAVAGATDKGSALEKQTARLEHKLDQLIKATKQVGKDVADGVNGGASNGHRRAA